jgi:hypothetical protein
MAAAVLERPSMIAKNQEATILVALFIDQYFLRGN